MKIPVLLLVSALRQRIESLETQIADLHTQISESQNTVANAIAASDRYLSIASIAISIIAVALGVYVGWCYSRVERIKKVVEDKESDILRLMEEVEKTNRQINGDLSSLYKRLRREETVTLLDRLVEVPEDISNIDHQLLSRELMEEDYERLKNAFSQLQDDETQRQDTYISLFFQHFAGLGIKDEDIRKHFIEKLSLLISLCFKKDILKSTTDMVAGLKTLSPDIRLQVVVPYYKVLKSSEFKDMYDLVDLLKSVLTEDQWKSVIAQTSDGEEVEDEITE